MLKLAVITLATLLAVPASAQMNHSMPMSNDPYDQAMMGPNDKMMAAKGATSAETFHRKMIEHHRAAVAMSQVALKATKDVPTVAMAKRIIADQQREIAEMNTWLKKNGKRPQ